MSDSTTAAVIGGGGLVGAYLVRLLREERPGWHVRVVDTFGASAASPAETAAIGAEVLSVDVRDREDVAAAVADRDVVFHLAALLSMQMDDHLREGIEVNVLGALNVIEAAAATRARLVLSSSITVFGAPHGRVDERTPFFHPDCPPTSATYGSTKLLAEYAAAITAMRSPGFSWMALRYSTVYGRRQHRRGVLQLNIVDNLRRARAGERPRFGGAPEEAHDYVHAADAARANLLAAEARGDATGRPYVIASGRATTNREIASTIADVTGSRLEPVWEEGEQDRFRVRLRDVAYDVSAARAALGYEPQWDIRRGIADLDAWLDEERTA